jgi:hypothetical protein
MISQSRRNFRSAIAGAAKDAQTVGVPLAQIAADLRALALLYAKEEPER